jgi:hypothetical protein
MPNVTRNVCRFERKCDPLTLKQWLACVVHHHTLLRGEEISARAQVAWGRLKAFANEGQDAQIGAEALVRLCAVIGDYRGLEMLLAPHGLHIVTAASVDSTPDLVLAEVLDVATASGRLAEEARAVMADRHIDDEERRRLINFARDTAKQAAEVEAALLPPVLRPREVAR